MELFSSEFFAALAAIIVIDLVLAGDNAIVIALAARRLEPRLRKLAIVWGTVGAIVVRAAMTLVVVSLLKIPGLMFFGGLMLIWIAYRLLVPRHGAGEGHDLKSASGFWGAMGTIVVADAMMGLDNVLAVAGAAHGSYLLVVLGLLISIPIVVWGSQLVLKLIDRFAAITYVGAGVLALTAAKMIADEPYLQATLEDQESLIAMLYVWLTLGILALAFLRNRFRRQDQLEARLLDSTPHPQDAVDGVTRILVPVDGSSNSLDAVRKVASYAERNERLDIHLLHVRSPLSQHIASFLRRRDVDAWHRDEGLKALHAARQLLAAKGVRCSHHVRLGSRGRVIAAMAEELGCDRIVMATARRNSLTRLIEDSVTQEVLESTRVPVVVIAGNRSSTLERIGVPISAAIAAAFLALVID
jgi:YjbE family integral membrane protein